MREPALCLDSNCSFGKIDRGSPGPLGGFALIPIVLSAKFPRQGHPRRLLLCLDSNCSFGKMPTRSTPRKPRFALIPIVLSAKSSRMIIHAILCFALIPIVLSAK